MKKFYIILFFAILIIVTGFLFLQPKVQAQTSSIVSGTAIFQNLKDEGYTVSGYTLYFSESDSGVSGTNVTYDAASGFNGFAWSPSYGWVDFNGLTALAPSFQNDNETPDWANGAIDLNNTGISFDPVTGNALNHWAWGGNVIGWIDFSGVSIAPTNDLCPNIAGIQTVIPTGMIVDSFGNCITPVDLCPNISGIQTVIPPGMITDSFGNCFDPSDVCPNIPGIQTSIPQDMIIDPTTGYCFTSIPIDLCPESGIQTTLPCADGDYCPTIPGIQTTLPCSSISYPYCHFDNIQNNTETGIDCGGVDCPSCKKVPHYIEH